MNGYRQNNCYSGRSGRPNAVVNQGCCNAVPAQAASCCNATPVRGASCCDNTAAGGIIVGGCTDACNKETTLRDYPIAMAYVPWQTYGNLYAQPQALRNGTVFAELNLDFAGRRCN